MSSPAQVRIESLLSARLFLDPQVVGNRVFFVSNMSGQMSLYAMDRGGSVPDPLIPPDIALQNPHLVAGHLYCAFTKLGKIMIMLDRHGDENYQPVLVPIDGGYPEPVFTEELADKKAHLLQVDERRAIAYFMAEARKEQMNYAYRADLKQLKIRRLGQSKWGAWMDGHNESHSKAIIVDGYAPADNVLYLWEKGGKELKLLHGKPLEERKEGETVPLNGIGGCQFVDGDRGLIFVTYLFEDGGGLGFLDIANPEKVAPVAVKGLAHKGTGMLDSLSHLDGGRYALAYNIDGCSWLYEAIYDSAAKEMRVDSVICGSGELAGGVLDGYRYDKARKRWAVSFTTATTPPQIYTIEGPGRKIVKHTRERVLGIPPEWLSPGEDAPFESFDGTRVSARLYLPPSSLDFKGPRPLVYYVHGGPHSQERPDFAWFSMPMIQFLAMNGFAVFVPNVRGSSGYGLNYMKQVERDWGGKDRLDHVHAMTNVLPKDGRLDVSRAAVMGRSYGGFMTLTLAARHPELWAAACDMFGPYDMLTFYDRMPETWKPSFALMMGDPVKDRDLLVERSPKTYIEQIACPLLVIQGKNDPRVVERESSDIVEQLRAKGKDVEYIVFEDEGHDVIKFPNRVKCYNAITDFFKRKLKP